MALSDNFNFDKLSEVASKSVEAAKNMGEKAGEMMRKWGDRASGMLEIGKLNSQISSANSSIEELKTRLGDHYFTQYSNGETLDDDAVVLCKTICDYLKEIESLKAQVAELKSEHENEENVCPACGTENDPEAVYCKQCGAKLAQEKGEDEETAKSESNTAAESEACSTSEESCECAEDKTCSCKEGENCDCENNQSEDPTETCNDNHESDVKVCPNCGTENTADSVYCEKCGSRL